MKDDKGSWPHTTSPYKGSYVRNTIHGKEGMNDVGDDFKFRSADIAMV